MTVTRDAQSAPVEKQEGPALLELRNVLVRRGRTHALDYVDLVLPQGRHTALLGPNGAGKSTLFQLLHRDLYPCSSVQHRCRVLGRWRWNVAELRGELGIVSADLEARVRATTTVLDVATSGFFSALGVYPNHQVSAEHREGAYAALERVGLEGFARRAFGTLSSGERRRALLARALAPGPHTLLLDEPAANLDLRAQFELLERLEELTRKGATLVLATHHLEEIVPAIEWVVLLQRGKVMAEGPKDSMLRSDRLERLFEIPLEVVRAGGSFRVVPRGRGSME